MGTLSASEAELEAEVRLIAESNGSRWRLRYLSAEDRDDTLADALLRFVERRRAGDKRPREALFDHCMNCARQAFNNAENQQRRGPPRAERRLGRQRERDAMQRRAQARTIDDVAAAERDMRKCHASHARRVPESNLAVGNDPAREAELEQFDKGLALLKLEGKRLRKQGLSRQEIVEQLGLDVVGYVEATVREVPNPVTAKPHDADNRDREYALQQPLSCQPLSQPTAEVPRRVLSRPCSPCLDCLWFDGVTKLPTHRVEPDVLREKMRIALEVREARGGLEDAAIRGDRRTNCDEIRRPHEAARRHRYGKKRAAEAA